MDEYGFEIQDLAGALPEAPLSELRFDAEDYTPFEQLVENIRRLPDRPKRVSPRSLSVNGRVVADRMDKYLAHSGESSSLLKEVLKSPRHYYIARHTELPEPRGRHFDFGTFVHSAVLEPTKFAKVKTLPDVNLSTTEGCRTMIRYYWELLALSGDVDILDYKIGALRQTIAELNEQATAAGYTFVKADEQQIINIIRICFASYGGGILPRLMQYVQPEVSMYGVDSSTGLRVKIRPDGLLLEENFGINAVLSIKTTSATSVEAFYRDCAKYRYELSEGMYLKVASEITGRRFTATLMLMIQSVAPYQMALIFWDAEDLQVGKYKYAQAMDIVKQCRDAKRWDGFDALAEEGAFGIIQGKLPSYIKTELLPQYVEKQD